MYFCEKYRTRYDMYFRNLNSVVIEDLNAPSCQCNMYIATKDWGSLERNTTSWRFNGLTCRTGRTHVLTFVQNKL